MYLRQIMESPKTYGRPQSSKSMTIVTFKWDPTIFTRHGEMEDEKLFKILFKDKKEQPNRENIKIPLENYGNDFKFLQKMGYDGKGLLGLRNQGIVETIQP